MPLDIIPQELKSFAEANLATGRKVVDNQMRFADAFVKANTTATAELANAQVSGVRQAINATSLSDLYESNESLLRVWWEKSQGLYQENTALVEDYQQQMQEIFSFDGELVNGARKAAEGAYSSVTKRVSSIMSSADKSATKAAAQKKDHPAKGQSTTAHASSKSEA